MGMLAMFLTLMAGWFFYLEVPVHRIRFGLFLLSVLYVLFLHSVFLSDAELSPGAIRVVFEANDAFPFLSIIFYILVGFC